MSHICTVTFGTSVIHRATLPVSFSINDFPTVIYHLAARAVKELGDSWRFLAAALWLQRVVSSIKNGGSKTALTALSE